MNVEPARGGHKPSLSPDDQDAIWQCYQIILKELAKAVPKSEDEKDKLVASMGLDPAMVRSPKFVLAVHHGINNMIDNKSSDKNIGAAVKDATNQVSVTKGVEVMLSSINLKDYIAQFFNSSPIMLLTTLQLLMQPAATATETTSESSREVQQVFSAILQRLADAASGDDKSGKIAAEVSSVSAAQQAASGALENSTQMLTSTLSALAQSINTVSQAASGTYESAQRAFSSISQSGS